MSKVIQLKATYSPLKKPKKQKRKQVAVLCCIFTCISSQPKKNACRKWPYPTRSQISEAKGKPNKLPADAIMFFHLLD